MYVHIAHCRLTQLLFSLALDSLNVLFFQSIFHILHQDMSWGSKLIGSLKLICSTALSLLCSRSSLKAIPGRFWRIKSELKGRILIFERQKEPILCKDTSLVLLGTSPKIELCLYGNQLQVVQIFSEPLYSFELEVQRFQHSEVGEDE